MTDPVPAGEPLPPQEAVWKTGRKKGRSRLRKKISRHIGYAGVRVAHAIVSRLPWSVGRGLAWVVGSCAYWILKRERDIATQNLTRVYGAEQSPAQIQLLVRRVFRHAASIAIDWSILRRWKLEKLERKFPQTAAELRTLESQIKATGSGVVMITGHCGNWEVLAHFFSQFTPGLVVTLAKRLYFEKYNDFVHRLRAEHGVDVIYSDESARKMIRAIRDGRMLALLCDQDLRTNSGVFVDFFGRPAYTVTFPVDLARKTGARVSVCVLLREKENFRFIWRPPFELPSTSDDDADVLASTQLWSSILEEIIRRYPEQWAWIHPRWRTTPDNPRRQGDAKSLKGKER